MKGVLKQADAFLCADSGIYGDVGNGDLLLKMLMDKAQDIFGTLMGRGRLEQIFLPLHFQFLYKESPALGQQVSDLKFRMFFVV